MQAAVAEGRSLVPEIEPIHAENEEAALAALKGIAEGALRYATFRGRSLLWSPACDKERALH